MTRQMLLFVLLLLLFVAGAFAMSRAAAPDVPADATTAVFKVR